MAEYDEFLPFYPRYVSTTAPLILRAVQSGGDYKTAFEKVVERFRGTSGSENEILANALREVSVFWGLEIIRQIPHGHVNTQVNPRFTSEDDIVSEARRIASAYKGSGIRGENVLVTIPATMEGLKATWRLGMEGINVNVNLVFSMEQVAAACEARATVISIAVGRVSDWGKTHGLEFHYGSSEDPGVQLARNAFNYIKQHKYKTLLLACNFRTIPQVMELVGCDVINLGHGILTEMAKMTGKVVEHKVGAEFPNVTTEKLAVNLAIPWTLPMKSQELLDDGIRRYTEGQIHLEGLAKQVMAKSP